MRFELTEQRRAAVAAWIVEAEVTASDPCFPSRQQPAAQRSTGQDAIVKGRGGRERGDP